MAERRRGRDEEQDRGTKDEHGIGREDEGMEDRGTKSEYGIGPEDEGVERPIWKEPRPTEREEGQDPKAELGGDDDTTWLEDPKAELGGDDDTEWLKDPAPIDVGPIVRDGGDEGDPAAVVWPDFDEGPESIDAETEDDDWADEDAETEVDVDVDTDEDVDTFEEVDIDDEKDD